MTGESDDIRVKFWTCRNRSHIGVDWDGNIATCIQCGATNEALQSHSWKRVVRRNSPALACSACGYIWMPESLGPAHFCPKGNLMEKSTE